MSRDDSNRRLPADLHFPEPIVEESSEAELRLDALLRAQATGAAPVREAPVDTPASRLERIRMLFAGELLPAAAELREKYATKGIRLEVDAADFLGGGRQLSIVIEFRHSGLRLDGTVTPNAIAFQQTRYSDFDRGGLAASGPTLRSRGLDAVRFREFLCERAAALVQAAVGR